MAEMSGAPTAIGSGAGPMLPGRREAAKISEQRALEHSGFAREGVTRGAVA